MSTIGNMVNNTLDRWNSEAELHFAQAGKAGKKMERKLWANGQIMVGPVGALPSQQIPLDRAIEIWKAGWKIVC